MNIFLDTSIVILSFCATVAVALSALSYFGEMQPARKKANRRMTMLDEGAAPRQVSAQLLTKARPNSFVSQFMSQEVYQAADRWCRQANPEFSLRKTSLTILTVFSVLVLFVVIASTKLGPSALLLGLIGVATLTAGVTWAVLSIMRTKRLRLLSEQLPAAIDLMVRALRAGHPVVAAIQLAANEMPDPIGTELGIVVDETTYGVELKEALASLAARSKLEDFAFLQVSVSIQSETGGNLAEILGNLGRVIRGRFMLEKKVKALASEGKMSAIILSALPVLMVGGISASNPGYYMDAIKEPDFFTISAGVALLYFFGLYLIHRITHFKY
jgi:tight adherence protein B